MFEQAPSMETWVTVTQLSDLLNSTGISARQAADKAEAEGIHLPYGSIAAYWSGKHPQHPSEKLLEGLAEVTGVSVRRLRRAAGAAPGEATPWTPPAEANRLTQRQREALEQLIKVIVSEPSVGDDTQRYPATLWRQQPGDDPGDEVPLIPSRG